VRFLLAALVALALAPAAPAKEGLSVVVLGPTGPPLVEPPGVFRTVMDLRLQIVVPPREPYVLVYPLMRNGVPGRPGRWYPGSGIFCSGWRSGVEAGCASARRLGGWLGSGIATGLYRDEPVRLLSLLRAGARLLPYGNEATAVKLALAQRGSPARAPVGCVRFTARWSQPGRPSSFCVAPQGGLYANGQIYPLMRATARFISGS
jgi:hypothetical protein